MTILQQNSKTVERISVIIIEKDEHLECWGSLKVLCDDGHTEFVYNTIRKKKFPFEYEGWKFYKVRFNKRQFYAKKL
jgi:hypothetical protein